MSELFTDRKLASALWFLAFYPSNPPFNLSPIMSPAFLLTLLQVSLVSLTLATVYKALYFNPGVVSKI